MIPILFDESETVFRDLNGLVHHGLGNLTDVVRGTVTEERNGEFKLELVYPVDGVHFEDIQVYRYIYVQTEPNGAGQPFEIREITRPFNGLVTVRAKHISYKLSGIICTPFSAETGSAGALTAIASHSMPSHQFTFGSSVSTEDKAFAVAQPQSVRACLGGTEGSIIDVYGGEWKFDLWDCHLYPNRGSDRGVTIRYGKNLTDVEQEESIDDLYTAVFPFWKSEEDYLELSTQTIDVDGSFPVGFTKVLPLDLSAEFDEKPTEDQLRSKAESYIATNQLGTPKVSLKVSFAQLSRTEDYKALSMLEQVRLCDTVHVYYAKLGVDVTAKVVKTVYDFVHDRYDSVTIGTLRGSLAETVNAQGHAVANIENGVGNVYRVAMDRASSAIMNSSGGYVRLYDKNSDGHWDELLAMDAEQIDDATNVWRLNEAGFGHSAGYEGAMNIAMTIDGKINADMILTGHMQAEYLNVGSDATREMGDYFRVFEDDDGKITTELGASDSAILLQEKNDRLRFVDTQKNELAYFAPNSFNIVNLQAFILQGLKIAVLDNGAYGFMAAE